MKKIRRTRFFLNLFLHGLIVAASLWGLNSRAETTDERPGQDDSCEYEKSGAGDCVWLSPLERKEKYEDLMREAYKRVQVLLRETQRKDDSVLFSYYDDVVSHLDYAQRSWEKYNEDECFLAGVLAAGAYKAAFRCEVDGIQQRFMLLNQSLICLEKKPVEERIQVLQQCFSRFLPLISGDGRW